MAKRSSGAGRDAQLEAISALGHELRRPLTVIRGAATLMLESAGELDQQTSLKMLSLIDHNIEELSDLIEDVLLMVHLEAGDLSLFMEPINVAEIAGAAVEAERRHTADHPVTVLGASPGVTVYADRARSTRALRALIHNAARFSDAQSPIEVMVHTDDPESVRFEVLDKGPGIPAMERERVFGPYQQAANGGPGLGLGLFLARGLATAMGGDVGLGDRPDGGLSVWFTLKRRG